MDDGARKNKTCILCTNGFTFEDIYRLAGILHYKLNIECNVHNYNNQPVLYIRQKSFEKFKALVLPHMHLSMLYKLGL
jgi:hypothetical protein